MQKFQGIIFVWTRTYREIFIICISVPWSTTLRSFASETAHFVTIDTTSVMVIVRPLWIYIYIYMYVYIYILFRHNNCICIYSHKPIYECLCAYLYFCIYTWRRGVMLITTTQLYSSKLELRFCAGSNSVSDVSEIRDGEDLWKRYQLEIRLNAFRRWTIPQKKFIITIIIIIIIITYLKTLSECVRSPTGFFELFFKCLLQVCNRPL